MKLGTREIALLMLVAMVVSACAAPSVPTQVQPTSAPPEAATSAPASPVPPTAAPAVEYNFLLMGALVHPFYGPMPQGIEDAAAKYGVSPVPEFTMPQQFDIVEQFSIIDSHVAKGMNGLAFQPDDPAAANAKISDLQALGISVINIGGCPNQPSPSPLCLTTDTEQVAYEMTMHMCDLLGGEGNIVHFTGQPEDTNTANSINGVHRALTDPKCTGITDLVDVTGNDAGPDASQTLVTSTLAAYSGQIDGIVSNSGIATDVIANQFRKDDNKEIKYIGLNNFEVILKAIADGYATGTMAQNPYGQAYLGTYTLKLMRDGCTYNGPFIVNTGALYITKDNLDRQAEDLAKITQDLASTWKDQYFTCPPGVD
jgi:ribose transport system substrate-binding protein